MKALTKDELVKLLKQGSKEWNKYVEEYKAYHKKTGQPFSLIDLANLDLSNLNLSEYFFGCVDLTGANLSRSDLTDAMFLALHA